MRAWDMAGLIGKAAVEIDHGRTPGHQDVVQRCRIDPGGRLAAARRPIDLGPTTRLSASASVQHIDLAPS